MAIPEVSSDFLSSYIKEARFAGRICGAGFSLRGFILAGVGIHRLKRFRKVFSCCHPEQSASRLFRQKKEKADSSGKRRPSE
jgi:hypothetical protein